MVKAKAQLSSLVRTGLLAQGRGRFLRLDMNESPSGLPEAFVRKVLRQQKANDLAMYPEYGALTMAIAKHDGLGAQNICLSNGSDAAIKYIFDAYVASGDRVLITNPTFAMYPVYCTMYGAKPVTVPYGADLEFPFADFLRQLSSGIRLAVIVNPNNPAGSVLSPAQLQQVIRKAEKNGVLLVVDEAYHYFYAGTVIKSVRKSRNLVVLRTFSKLCGLAALRLGYAAACPEVIVDLKKVKPTFDVNGLAVRFAEALLAEPAIMAKAIDATARGKAYLIKKLRMADIPYRDTRANFVLIQCRGRVEAVRKKLRQRGILVHGGFGQQFLKEYLRVTVGDLNDMAEFWKQFEQAWGKS